jgi:hypothetical protein
VTVSGDDSVRVRVHQYERRFRENLTGVFLPMKLMEVPRTTLAARSATFTDGARFCRTTATPIWGVSDPLRLKRGAVIGGWQRGSLTARMPPSLLLTAALTATRAAHSAAPLHRTEPAHCEGHRRIACPQPP